MKKLVPSIRFKACPRHRACDKITQIAAILLIILSVGPLAHGQSSYNEEYYFPVAGLTGGVLASQIDGDGYKGYNKTGLTGGGIIFLPFGDMDMPIDATLALSMEIQFSQKGAKGLDPIPNAGVLSQRINLQYAEVPFMLNLYRGSRKSGFGAGFGIGYLASSEELIDNGSGTIIKPALPFKKFELSFVLTGNIHIWNGFFISPRFQYSMLSIRNNNGKFGGRNEQYNNVVALRLMYLFKRGGY